MKILIILNVLYFHFDEDLRVYERGSVHTEKYELWQSGNSALVAML